MAHGVGRYSGRRTSMNDYVERALKQRKEGKVGEHSSGMGGTTLEHMRIFTSLNNFNLDEVHDELKEKKEELEK